MRILDGDSFSLVCFMVGQGSWALFAFPGSVSLCCEVGVAGVRLAPVCGVAWVVPAGKWQVWDGVWLWCEG